MLLREITRLGARGNSLKFFIN
uniref:Uncharacterized protein n=1 Tax=Rhizophora mucronata TaxID=61149 RepID=A0A2P2Q1F3_RHIMU